MILVILSFLLACEGILEIHYPTNDTNDTRYFNVVPWFNSISNDTKPLVFTTILSDFMNMTLSNTTVIHYYEFEYYGYESSLNPNLVADLLRFQQLGVHCVLLVETNVPIGQFSITFKMPEEVVIPVGWISLDTWKSTRSESGLSASIQWDPNQWELIINSWGFTFGRVLSFLFYCFNITIATYKIILFLKEKVSLSIAVMCLGLELFANTSNIVCIIIHPFYSVFKIPYSFLFDTLFFPFQMSSDFLVLFFWLELTSSVLFRGKKLDKMKIPAFVTITILILIELILDVVICIFISLQWYALVALVSIFRFIAYNILGISIIITYFYTSFKVLKGSTEIPLKTKKRFLVAAYRIIASATVCVILLLLYIMDFLTQAIPLGFLINLFFSLLSIIQITIFVPKQKDEKEPTKSTRSKSTQNNESAPKSAE